MALRPSTKADFLELWRRVLPRSYTEPIERDEVGFDIPAAQAAIWAEAEASFNLSQQGYYLRRHSTATGPVAAGAVSATGAILVARAAPTVGDLALPAGTAFLALGIDSLNGELFLGRYFSTEEVDLPEGALGPFSVPVQAEFPGYTGNLAPGYVTAFQDLGRASVPASVTSPTQFLRVPAAAETVDRFDANLVGRYVRLVGALTSENHAVPRRVLGVFTTGGELGITVDLALDPGDVGALVTVEVEEYEDFGLTVTQPTALVGGTPDALGALGTDRNRGRLPGESDESYRIRLGSLADTISPASHIRILDRILSPRGIGYEYLETGAIDELMGFTWDVHPYDYGQICPPIPQAPGSDYIGSGAVWLGPTTLTRFFIVCVENSSLGEFGFAYDSPSYFPGYPNAWDLGFFDGSALGYQSVLARVWADLNEARAAGVGFIIIRDGSL